MRSARAGSVFGLAFVLALACSSKSDGGGHPPADAGGGGAATAGSAVGGGGAATAGGAGGSGGAATAGSPGGGNAAQAGHGAGGRGGGGSAIGGDAGRSDDAGAGGGSETTACKRGIAANTAPGPAFSPNVAWWYDWSMKGAGSVEFVPMVWGQSDAATAVPAGAKYLLTFNEPNFHSQSNLTPQAAAALWPTVQANARAAHVPIVSPAMNFCGPASDCNGTDPYQYLKDFFAACADCEVDYVAVHWYNCDLPSLKDYLEPGGSLEGFEQFDKPIWLTEFSCDDKASAADQEAYMRAAVPYLEANPHVFRYSWFSADPIPNAKLVAADGSPTALGQVYSGLPQSCSP
ncbi:MAG TPA: glycoside hydrolase family protein [Polyangiaceae bacterium]|nr:glycoside hydrolase family protein [Polyangiaceae bacterium]